MSRALSVIPAKAGTQLPHKHQASSLRCNWVPAFAGMTTERKR